MPRKSKNKNGEVVDFTGIRQEKIEEKRRQYERILFKNTLGVYSVLEKKGLHGIELIDISEGGLSFQLPENDDIQFSEGDSIILRLYFASETFLPVAVKVVRVTTSIEEGSPTRRYGCIMDKSLASYSAVYHFVHFIKKCAEHGHNDDNMKILY